VLKKDSAKFAAHFLDAVTRQDADELLPFFEPGAAVYWHNSDETFSSAEYIRANCEYPGEWKGNVERVEQTETSLVIVAKVWSGDVAARSVSFIQFGASGKISRLDEYWGDIAEPPEWRRKMHIGAKTAKTKS
jgi:carbohydrate-selective porin OprB